MRDSDAENSGTIERFHRNAYRILSEALEAAVGQFTRVCSKFHETRLQVGSNGVMM